MEAWRGHLLDARRKLGLGRAKLAGMAGVSAAIIRAYESGRRRPTRATLDAILAALRLDRIQANAIRDAAGFARERTVFSDLPHYFYARGELAAAVEATPWPQFVTDDAFDLLAANCAARTLWGLDAAALDRQPNLLAVMSVPSVAGRFANWDEMLRMLVGMFKGWRMEKEQSTAASQYFRESVARFSPANSGVLLRMLRMWPEVEPMPVKVRWGYDIAWQDPGAGRLEFRAIVSTANEREGFAFQDWVPACGASWRAFGGLAATPALPVNRDS